MKSFTPTFNEPGRVLACFVGFCYHPYEGKFPVYISLHLLAYSFMYLYLKEVREIRSLHIRKF